MKKDEKIIFQKKKGRKWENIKKTIEKKKDFIEIFIY